jgi:hypothetical protein
VSNAQRVGTFYAWFREGFWGVFLLAIQGLGLILGAISGMKFVQIKFTSEPGQG